MDELGDYDSDDNRAIDSDDEGAQKDYGEDSDEGSEGGDMDDKILQGFFGKNYNPDEEEGAATFKNPNEIPGQNIPEYQGSGIWDPIEEDRAAKRRKKEQQQTQQQQKTSKDQRRKVVMHGLKNVPHLNGIVGYTFSMTPDPISGRISVLIPPKNDQKNLKPENITEVHTGSLGRIHGLQGAAHLNSLLCEYGKYNIENGRYQVVLEDGSAKSIKADNIELLRTFEGYMDENSEADLVVKKSDVDSFRSHEYEGWQRFFGNLPVPQFLSVDALAKDEFRKSLANKVMSSAKQTNGEEQQSVASFMHDILKPTLVSGRSFETKCNSPSNATAGPTVPETAGSTDRHHFVAISCARHACCEKPGSIHACRQMMLTLHMLAKQYQKEFTGRKVYFMLPSAITKSFPTLHAITRKYYPYYLKCCKELVMLQDENYMTKAWSRIDLTLAHMYGMWTYAVRIADVSVSENLAENKQNFDFASRALKPRDLKVGPPVDGHSLTDGRRVVKAYQDEYYTKDTKIEVYDIAIAKP